MNQLRIPRPMGISQLCFQYKNEGEEVKKRVEDRWIQEYIIRGFELEEQGIKDLKELANWLGIGEEEIYERINGITERIIGNGEGMQTRALFGLGMNWVLKDKALTIRQLQTLRHSQGDTFKPFLSATLNQAIDNTLKASKPIIEMIKALNSNTQITNQVLVSSSESKVQNNTFIGINEALQILEDKGLNRLLTEPTQLEALYEEHGLSDTPTIQASNTGELEHNKELEEVRKISRHTTRRQEELDIEE